jgi:hypothetical protein
MKQAKLLLTLGLCASLVGCGESITESLGLGRNPPDEFAVVDRPSLALPPDFSLKPPKPGAPRPQEINMRERATTVLFGDAVLSDKTSDKSSGEKALLDAAGAGRAEPGIRQMVDKEASEKVVTSQRLIDELLWWRTPEAPATTVDAAGERDRLKQAAEKGEAINQTPTPVIEKKKRGWLGM